MPNSRKLQAEQYRELATTCAAMADRAKSDEEKRLLRQAENGYLFLAESDEAVAAIAADRKEH